MKDETKLKKWTLSRWKKELDKVFSEYIRNKYAKNGEVQCYTCGVTKPINEMHNGHFNPRQYLSTRWDERNCRVQCPQCNTFNNGQPTIFADRLVQEYGKDILEKLSRDNFKPIKLDKHWYLKKVKEYQAKLKEYE